MTLTLPDSGAPIGPDGRRIPASALRNGGPILQILQDHGPKTGRMLELAAGSGLHTALFAAALPGLDWQPTDVDPTQFASITAWAATCPTPVRPPVVLDATQPGWASLWPDRDAVLLVNLLHLIAQDAAATLIGELARALAPGGAGFVYGPFLRDGLATSAGDAAFDAALRAQDPRIGYKDLAWVMARISAAGLRSHCIEMPANNLMILIRA